ncbi:S8 family peptidase [uncultured Cohaesibacter sp.]|uniref:S8 family peptidase n=1 Tax=uncultured Cohaesibacter sp. TaxID=1002546 RepID=UPI002930BEC6|nr:S8 family peptidase [uncultured Cohaesibacter sp.]
MPAVDFPHLFLENLPNSQDYTNPSGGGGEFLLPDRPSRSAHADMIRDGLNQAWREAEVEQEGRRAVSLPTRNGTYIEFESAPGFDLKFDSLETRRSGIRLLNVREEYIDQDASRKTIKATVYVPKGKENILLNKVERYKTEQTASDRPKNQALIESIENLSIALIHALWCDDVSLIPSSDQTVWCEVWLRTDENWEEQVVEFRALAERLEIEVRPGYLSFPERTVLLINAHLAHLNELLSSFDRIAEFRRAKETADFWTRLDNSDQADWVEALVGRLSIDATSNASVCVIDTGVNNAHPLLAPLIPDENCFTNNADWGSADRDGHGTNMCGTAAFGEDLGHHLQTDTDIEIPYQIESVKIIPSTAYNDEQELNGVRTIQSVARAELENSDFSRAICMAITSTDGRDRGRPSSWSGALDALISGADDDEKRLFFVSAGNINEPSEWAGYPDTNLTNTVHDPGQSWNAITVGAVTFHDHIENEEVAASFTPIASAGELSPYSTTSLTWEKRWPNKPDIVMEGGNAGIDSTGFTSTLEDLSLLSTNSVPNQSMFTCNYATSAATALAARQAAMLVNQYPEAWPETIRGLIVHSAQWTDQLKEQFYEPSKSEKKNLEQLIRICGFGIPDFPKALSSARNSLTLIAQKTIQPFEERDGSGYKAKDMHFFELPWPKEALLELPGETPVRIDVTLSYFVEPGPGEIGWRDKYRYRSHGLDFNLKKPTEDIDDFLTRINKAVRDDDDIDYGGSGVAWEIGALMGRTRGSLHRDWVHLNAAEAAESNVIGIFPRTGWWKERHHLGKGESQTRYSLIVTLALPEVDIDVDIYSPVAIELGVPPIEIGV